MKDFSGKIAVVTGGGSGIGRALVQALTSEGCSVAMCDIREADMLETVRIAEKTAVQGVKITTFVADVAQEKETLAFRDHTGEQHETDHLHLLFNNAGIGAGGSFVNSPRDQWERTFAVCWYGVYYNARAFLPMLLKAPEAHMINVSSVNGFWASLGPQTSHTAYSAAKFAVKGFTEALINDFRNNAPHVKASVVMPGHIGTNIAINSMAEFAPPDGATAEAKAMVEAFRDNGLPPPAAAKIILDGVREARWRILVGPDAVALDKAVRARPEDAYEHGMADLVARAMASG
ncbi:SDR family NAD(P)-dependent oxidoreductase [Phenylobacterium sp.]|uniref:SDR family NAD(P)-dependent oxidoreductase n=1 Tax=Phenylobacterium sp. TaxID=1871053 RepID=UPI0025DF39F1|nr:SDR family NAD(P)-dependent oxidoreductase [Phenylobacterium sp.]MCA6285074.1 SDR family NAD(P)-dependent oxidoreductase [Phenylobacterium sp.]MCA6288904.1 SDR family NAD(P)-dependent oxidoreductase [Phenylobacterium sp.]MCA6310998.1 SDR family NAD(P)-dependent oxidoreductase [Phenylobacterium sp.]MCA6324759.1 SDR family NAD(P)-dependent oxidoreductase [Phenylobacterium sp.]MCA6337069.1 SDR family NAD(P)-dependent oxidoreductase [Phenylobacterium sp.]